MRTALNSRPGLSQVRNYSSSARPEDMIKVEHMSVLMSQFEARGGSLDIKEFKDVLAKV